MAAVTKKRAPPGFVPRELQQVIHAREEEDKKLDTVKRSWDLPNFKFRPFLDGEVVWLVEYSPLRPAQVVGYEEGCLLVKEFNSSAPYRVFPERCTYFGQTDPETYLRHLRSIQHHLVPRMELEYKAAADAEVDYIFNNLGKARQRDPSLKPDRDYLESGCYIRYVRRLEGYEDQVINAFVERIRGPRFLQASLYKEEEKLEDVAIEFSGHDHSLHLSVAEARYSEIRILSPLLVPGRKYRLQDLWFVKGLNGNPAPSDSDMKTAQLILAKQDANEDVGSLWITMTRDLTHALMLLKSKREPRGFVPIDKKNPQRVQVVL